MKLQGYSNYEIYPEEGKIWSYKRNKFIGSKHHKKGYWTTGITNDDGETFYSSIHRLIWIAVNGPIPEGMEINHIDENKDNNSISNLSIVTPKENANWGTRDNRSLRKRIKPVLGLLDSKPSIMFNSIIDAKEKGFYLNADILKGEKTYKGYKWQYVKDYLQIY